MAGDHSRAGVSLDAPSQSRAESLCKALVYRVFMIALTVAVAYLVTTDTTASLQIGLVTNVVKTGTYYVYERFWDRLTLEVFQRG